MSYDLLAEITKVQFLGNDLRLLREVEMLWPPPEMPEVLVIDGQTFVACSSNMFSKPTFRLAKSLSLSSANLA